MTEEPVALGATEDEAVVEVACCVLAAVIEGAARAGLRGASVGEGRGAEEVDSATGFLMGAVGSLVVAEVVDD